MAATLTIATVTPQRVHLVLSNPDAANVGKVMRADVNGTHTVRAQAGQLPSTVTSLDLFDYEYALASGRKVTYTAYSTANAVLASVSFTTGDPGHILIIGCPLYPTNGVVLAPGDTLTNVSFAVSWSTTRTSLSTLHTVIGRSDPVPVLHTAATRAGTVTLICPDHATCERIEAQLSLAQVFQLRQTDVAGLDAYFVVTSLAASNVDLSLRWQLVVGLVEVAWPVGSFVPTSVWTYADLLAAGYGDYNGVAASFENYATLLDRVPIP